MPWTQNAMMAPDDQFPHEDFPDGADTTPATPPAADAQPSEVARRYCDLTVAIVALDERIRALQASADRIEEVLAASLHAADAALTMLVGSLHDTNEALREAIGNGTRPRAN